MNYITVKLEERFIVGLAVRTSMETAMKDIPDVAGRFQENDLQLKIENRESNDVICAYFDYETDHMGPYSYIIGSIVPDDSQVPEGMVCVNLPAGTFLQIKVKGDYPDSLIEAWQSVWGSEDLPRTFTTDFELYGDKFVPEYDNKFSLFISIEDEEDFN